jgi:hypothetical protein
VDGGDGLVGQEEAAAANGPEVAVEDVADVDGVVVAAGDRPHGLDARRDAPQRARGAADRLGAAVEQDGVGERLVDRGALGVQRGEALAVARQRPALATRAAPGGRLVDVEHHDRVPGQQLAHAGRADRAAADRDDRRRGRLEHLGDDILLDLPERTLAVGGEVVLDRGPQALFELTVGVDRPHAQRGGGGPGAGRLAGAHEPDED